MIILKEKHTPSCTCSYCSQAEQNGPGSFGLWLPQCKARNSWRVIWWRGSYYIHYLRWTLPAWMRDLCVEKHPCDSCLDTAIKAL